MQLLPFYQVKEDGKPRKREFNPAFRFNLRHHSDDKSTPYTTVRREERIAKRLDPHFIEELPRFDPNDLMLRVRKAKHELPSRSVQVNHLSPAKATRKERQIIEVRGNEW